MDSFSVETTFTAADWRTYVATVARKAQGDSHTHFLLTKYLGTACVVVLLSILSFTFPRELRIGSMALGAVAGISSFWIRWWLTRRQYGPEENGTVLGPRTLIFASDGVTIQRSNSSAFYSWSSFKELEVERENLFIWLERINAVMVPLKDLPSGMTAEEAATRIRAFAKEAETSGGANIPIPLATSAVATHAEAAVDGRPTSAVDAHPATSASLASSASPGTAGPGALRRALDFLSLRPRQAAVGAPSDWAIAAFTTGSLILWLVLDRLRYGHDAEFVPYDAPGFSWYMLPFLLAAWLASRLTRPRVRFRNILFLLTVAGPVIIGAAFLLAHDVPRNLVTAVAVAFVVYLIVYLEVGLRALAGRRQSAAVTAIIAITLLFVSVNSAFYFYPTLWSDPEPDTTDNETQVEKAEDLLITQGPRIEAEVNRIATSEPGHPGVYFVGFAGVGRQKVFSDEIKLAARRVSERYDAEHRTVLLLNDRRDVDSHPIATVEGLKLALKDVAGKMDIEQDVLFLSLSSHGSEDPSLSVSNIGVSLRDLSGADLADALRASGIKWKVIVISACHAGAFIDALRDDNSIILTAAAGDRTSFGCNDDRELTYFGEAFYRDALPQSATLQDAFSRAKADIASREEREHVRASNPQAFFGKAMAEKLAGIDSTARCNNGCRQSVPESSQTR